MTVAMIAATGVINKNTLPDQNHSSRLTGQRKGVIEVIPVPAAAANLDAMPTCASSNVRRDRLGGIIEVPYAASHAARAYERAGR
jgi:hypothetical protein